MRGRGGKGEPDQEDEEYEMGMQGGVEEFIHKRTCVEVIPLTSRGPVARSSGVSGKPMTLLSHALATEEDREKDREE